MDWEEEEGLIGEAGRETPSWIRAAKIKEERCLEMRGWERMPE